MERQLFWDLCILLGLYRRLTCILASLGRRLGRFAWTFCRALHCSWSHGILSCSCSRSLLENHPGAALQGTRQCWQLAGVGIPCSQQPIVDLQSHKALYGAALPTLQCSSMRLTGSAIVALKALLLV